MSLRRLYDDEQGATAVEFALLMTAFIFVIFGLIRVGVMMWTQAGLQHGAEVAARCASVNTTLCGSQSQIQNYAAANSLAVNPPSSAFTVPVQPSTGTCGSNMGNLVTASYSFNFFPVGGQITLAAKSCYPCVPNAAGTACST
jgi:Flp pilus assembly protein TadG